MGMGEPELSLSGTGYVRVRDAIRERIISGAYPPGMRLKTQDLSEQFGISTNPIREALQQLQGEGLVVILPNKGATVRRIDEQLIRHIYEIGEALDGILANRCAAVATAHDVALLRDIQSRMEEAHARGDSVGRADYNGEFHNALGTISGNTEAMDIRRRHQNLIRTIRQQYGYSPERHAEIHAEHRAIIEAIAARSIDAAERAARVHAVNSLTDMLLRYRGRPG
jgi:DNA-binding GntR family transcriptional regulator